MRAFTVAFCFFAALAGSARAQVSKSDFLAKIDAFAGAMDKKDVGAENSSIDQLSAAMSAQMTWMQSHIETLNAAYAAANDKAKSDMATALAEEKKAQSDQTDAEAALKSGKPGAQADLARAQTDEKKAQADGQNANEEVKTANRAKADAEASILQLNLEKRSADDVKGWKGNLTANKDRIIASLKTFASTLQ